MSFALSLRSIQKLRESIEKLPDHFERWEQETQVVQYALDEFRARVKGEDRDECRGIFLATFGQSQGFLAAATVLHMMPFLTVWAFFGQMNQAMPILAILMCLMPLLNQQLGVSHVPHQTPGLAIAMQQLEQVLLVGDLLLPLLALQLTVVLRPVTCDKYLDIWRLNDGENEKRPEKKVTGLCCDEDDDGPGEFESNDDDGPGDVEDVPEEDQYKREDVPVEDEHEEVPEDEYEEVEDPAMLLV
eukprot:s28_g14.t1